MPRGDRRERNLVVGSRPTQRSRTGQTSEKPTGTSRSPSRKACRRNHHSRQNASRSRRPSEIESRASAKSTSIRSSGSSGFSTTSNAGGATGRFLKYAASFSAMPAITGRSKSGFCRRKDRTAFLPRCRKGGTAEMRRRKQKPHPMRQRKQVVRRQQSARQIPTAVRPSWREGEEGRHRLPGPRSAGPDPCNCRRRRCRLFDLFLRGQAKPPRFRLQKEASGGHFRSNHG